MDMRSQDLGFDPRDLPRNADAARRLAGSLLEGQRATTDAEQDVLLHSLRKPPTLQGGWKRWFRGAVRKRRLHLRREEAGRVHRERVAGWKSLERASEDPRLIVERAETCERLMHAVMGLPEPYRTPVILRYVEEHDARQIAEMLERPLSTVQTQLLRGLSLLRAVLSAQDRRDGGDWKQALGLFCWPTPSAPPLPALDAAASKSWFSAKLGLVSLGVTLAVLLPGLWRSLEGMEGRAAREDAPAGEQRGRPRGVAAQLPGSSSHAAQGRAPASDPELLVAAEAKAPELKETSISVLCAASREPIPSATARFEADGVRGGSQADGQGRIVLASEASEARWLLVEAAGFLPARLLTTPGTGTLEVLLCGAGRLTVESQGAGGRLLAARTWPVNTFPMALRPIELQPSELGLDAAHKLEARLAPGEYVVSALCEFEDGQRRIDQALVRIAVDHHLHWVAFDSEECDLILRPVGMPPQARHWAASILLGATGQKAGSVEGRADEPLHLDSVPPGEHELQVYVDGVPLPRRAISVPPGPGLEAIEVELPSASLQLRVSLLAEGGELPMVILRGPLDSGSRRPTTYFGRGSEVAFNSLSPGDYAAWVRTEGRLGRSALKLRGGFNQATVSPEQGINATLIFSAPVALGRTEALLIAEDGARIPLTRGEESGSQATFGDPRTRADSDPRGSLGLSLPAGRYELATTVDGEARPRQSVLVPVQGSVEVLPPEPLAELRLTLHRDGTPIASQVAELTGHLPGHSPLDIERGELWMLSCVTGSNGDLTLSLAPARWTVALAGGEVRSFEVGPTTREVSINFSSM